MKNFAYQSVAGWPPSAWIACWDAHGKEVVVRHGCRVETHEDWFGEIVWDGDYAEARFTETDVVFGSGGKREPERLIFVGSASTLDRLHSLKKDNRWYISNSLACLLSETDSTIDPGYESYYRDFMRILDGLNQQDKSLSTSNGQVRLTYFRNLVWRPDQLVEEDKPHIARERSCFSSYLQFLESKLKSCAMNLSDSARRHPYELIGTASSGFDSPTAAAIGRAAGLKDVISIAKSRDNQDDCGDAIAQRLELRSQIISRDAWQQQSFPEVPFLSVDGKGEDVYFTGAEQLLQGKVLLTGYCGSVWGGRTENYFDLKRTDPSGLSLSEFRLWIGFINFPVPVLGVYRANDLLHLMSGEEAKSWSTGNPYDKPFCRFVLESAGVPGNLYGQEKKAASVLLEDRRSFLTDTSRLDFHDFLGRKDLLGTIRKLRRASSRCLRLGVGWSQFLALRAHRLTGLPVIGRYANSSRLSEYSYGNPEFQHLFPWAIEHAVARYKR